jgi:hypothetical protein
MNNRLNSVYENGRIPKPHSETQKNKIQNQNKTATKLVKNQKKNRKVPRKTVKFENFNQVVDKKSILICNWDLAKPSFLDSTPPRGPGFGGV